MRHDLQVVGSYSDMHAHCSCGAWSKHSKDWEWADGTRVLADSWDEFADHVRQENPTAVVCWNLSFWGRQIPANERTYSNMSHGCIFSSFDLAVDFVRRGNYVLHDVKRLMLSADDPQIDFILQDVAEQDRRLGIERVPEPSGA